MFTSTTGASGSNGNVPEDDSDYDREPVDNATGVQICVIIVLTLFIAVKVITEHPEWFGA